jgi:hypothetical protein
VTLTGRLIEVLGKKHGPGKHPTKSFTLHLTRATVAAGITKTMTVSLPPAALNGLKHHATESVRFTLTITNANGTSHAMAKISSIKPA